MRTKLRVVITPRLIDATVFGLVSAFMAFSGIGIIKFIALAFGLLVALIKRPVRWIPLLPAMALLVGINLMLHQTSLTLDSLWLFGVERFTVYLVLSALIYTLYGDPDLRTSNAIKLAVMILINLGMTGLLFIPPLISSWKGLSTRLGEYGWLNLVYVSANLMAYLVFIGHLLVEWCWEKLSSRLAAWVRWSAHGMLFTLGVFAQSRAYWIYLFLAGGLWLIRHWATQRASSRRFWTTVLIGSGGVALLILILRALPQTSIWIAQLSNNVTGVSLEGRFWSLVRLVFTDNALLDASTRERIDLLSAAWFQFLSSPLFGQGFGAFAAQAVWAIQRGVFILRSGYAHADLFELAASTGLLGVGLYAGAILPSVKKVRHESWIWIALVISLATGMVFRMLFDKAIWWILLVLVALLAKEKDHA